MARKPAVDMDNGGILLSDAVFNMLTIYAHRRLNVSVRSGDSVQNDGGNVAPPGRCLHRTDLVVCASVEKRNGCDGYFLVASTLCRIGHDTEYGSELEFEQSPAGCVC